MEPSFSYLTSQGGAGNDVEDLKKQVKAGCKKMKLGPLTRLIFCLWTSMFPMQHCAGELEWVTRSSVTCVKKGLPQNMQVKQGEISFVGESIMLLTPKKELQTSCCGRTF